MPRQGSRPHTWLAGPDPIDHRLYVDCQRARAQAWYRGEEWFISEQEYIQLWREHDRYKQKGRTRDSLCLVKIDKALPWTVDNVEFLSRLEHFRSCPSYQGGRRRRKDRVHA